MFAKLSYLHIKRDQGTKLNLHNNKRFRKMKNQYTMNYHKYYRPHKILMYHNMINHYKAIHYKLVHLHNTYLSHNMQQHHSHQLKSKLKDLHKNMGLHSKSLHHIKMDLHIHLENCIMNNLHRNMDYHNNKHLNIINCHNNLPFQGNLNSLHNNFNL